MPRGDRTGPAGMGPMTGRGAGYCAGFNRPGYANPAVAGGGAFGRGAGRGGGRGRRNWYYQTGMPGWSRAANGMPAYGSPAPAGGGYVPGQAGYGEPSPEDELQMLRQQSEALSQQLEQINQRITELED